MLYTIPSIAFFFLLLPITGLGLWTAVIPLTAYTLQIIYRNTLAGLSNVPADAKDAGRGMGMSDRQLLRRVELPLATPEIVAGLRIAIVSTVAIATLAFLAGAGGLGDPLYAQPDFKTNIIMVGVLTIAMALALDLIVVLGQRFADAVAAGEVAMILAREHHRFVHRRIRLHPALARCSGSGGRRAGRRNPLTSGPLPAPSSR